MNAHALYLACERFEHVPQSPTLAGMYSHCSDGVTGSVESADDPDLDSLPWDMSDVENVADLPTPCAPEATEGAAKPRTSKNKIARFLLECSGGDPDDCGKGSIREKAAIYEEHCNDQNVSPYNIALGQEFMRCIDATYRTRDRLRELRDQVIEYCEIKDAEERSSFLREHPEMPLLPEMAHLHEAVARDDTSEELSTYLLRNSGRSAADVQKHKNTKHTKSAVRVFTMLCDEVREDPRGSKSRAKAFMQAAGKLTTTKLQAVEKLTTEFVSLTDRDCREQFLKKNPEMILLEEEVRPPSSDSLTEHRELHQDVRAGRDTGCLRVARTDSDDYGENTEVQVDDEGHTDVARRRTRVSKRQRDDTDKTAENDDKDEDAEDKDEDAEDEDAEDEDKDAKDEGEDAEDDGEDAARPRTRGAKRQCVVHAASVDDDDYDTVTAGAMRILKECDPSISQAALEYAWARSGLRTQVAELRSTLAHLAAEHEAQETKARNELVAMATKNVTQLLAMSKRTGVLRNQPELKSLLRQLDARVTGEN